MIGAPCFQELFLISSKLLGHLEQGIHMHQSVKKKILSFLQREGISIANLEKKAGLKINTLRNIMYDKSKNPSLETIIKLSDALQVSIDYLIRPNEENLELHKDLFLSKEVFDYVSCWLVANKADFDMEKVFIACDEIYNYARKTGSKHIDKKFATYHLENL